MQYKCQYKYKCKYTLFLCYNGGVSVKLDSKAILNGIERKDRDRQATTLYLSKALYKEFKSLCGDAAASKVIEELMRKFIEDAPSGHKAGKG